MSVSPVSLLAFLVQHPQQRTEHRNLEYTPRLNALGFLGPARADKRVLSSRSLPRKRLTMRKSLDVCAFVFPQNLAQLEQERFAVRSEAPDIGIVRLHV